MQQSISAVIPTRPVVLPLVEAADACRRALLCLNRGVPRFRAALTIERIESARDLLLLSGFVSADSEGLDTQEVAVAGAIARLTGVLESLRSNGSPQSTAALAEVLGWVASRLERISTCRFVALPGVTLH